MSDETQTESDVIYTPAPGEAQLTVRAVLSGCLLGGVVCMMNIYFGLQTGWSIGGSLISAILGYSLWSVTGNGLTRLETNIAQTAGSAAGSMTSAAGLLGAIPAMTMLGYELHWTSLMLWAGSVAWLGVFFAVPLRRQMVLVEKLRFPTGTATAETIMAMHAEGDDAKKKAWVLLGFGIAASAFQFLVWGVGKYTGGAIDLSHPDLTGMIGVLAVPAAYGFSLLISPLMLGAGVLIGMRVAASLLLGAVIAWAVLAPAVENAGWVTGATMSYADGARGWILWPGVALMVADALTSLALSWRTILNTFRSTSDGDAAEDTSDEMIPNSWWIGGLGVASLLTIAAAWQVFEIHPVMTVLAIALSSVLAAIAVRSTGETDINPIGGMGKVTQLVYGGIAPGQVATNLMTAAITGSGASQAGDMMQDLKTGYMLGASPRKQLVAQLAGITVGIPLCVGVYTIFDGSRDIGGVGKLGSNGEPLPAMPAPAAHAWKAMAELLSKGVDAMPAHALEAVVVAALVGVVLTVLKKVLSKDLATLLPSGLAVGIAFIVPAYYSVAMFFGALLYMVWQRVDEKAAAALGFSVASGLIAGEGLTGVVTAMIDFVVG